MTSPVDKLRGLDRPDWDTYGASPVTPEVVELAERVYGAITFVPTVNGGFQVEFHCGGVDAEIEFSEGGELEGVCVSKGSGWTS